WRAENAPAPPSGRNRAPPFRPRRLRWRRSRLEACRWSCCLLLAGGGGANCEWKGRAPLFHSPFATGFLPPPYSLTLDASCAAILTSWASLAESGTICTDRSSPTRIGPMTVAPPSSCNSLVEIEAEWNAGMISTLAGPDRRQNG